MRLRCWRMRGLHCPRRRQGARSCRVRVESLSGKQVTTIEGLARDESLHPLQAAFIETGAVQCGFCTPGMIMAAKSLLDAHPDPSDEEIRTALSGNLCRCTGYASILEAVRKVSLSAGKLKEVGSVPTRRGLRSGIPQSTRKDLKRSREDSCSRTT